MQGVVAVVLVVGVPLLQLPYEEAEEYGHAVIVFESTSVVV